MDNEEFNELMGADICTQDGALKVIQALAKNEEMTDEQFNQLMSKVMTEP